jgi:hypothetical protein
MTACLPACLRGQALLNGPRRLDPPVPLQVRFVEYDTGATSAIVRFETAAAAKAALEAFQVRPPGSRRSHAHSRAAAQHPQASQFLCQPPWPPGAAASPLGLPDSLQSPSPAYP